MGFFSGLKKVAGAAATEVRAQSQENVDVLEAYLAVGCLAASAEGGIDTTERANILRKVQNTKEVKGLFNESFITPILDSFIQKAADGGGRQELASELEDVKNRPETTELRKKLYLFAKDVVSDDGIGEKEAKRLQVIATVLGVDPNAFLFDD